MEGEIMENRKKTIRATVSRSLVEILKKRANHRGMSLSGYIEYLLQLGINSGEKHA